MFSPVSPSIGLPIWNLFAFGTLISYIRLSLMFIKRESNSTTSDLLSKDARRQTESSRPHITNHRVLKILSSLLENPTIDITPAFMVTTTRQTHVYPSLSISMSSTMLSHLSMAHHHSSRYFFLWQVLTIRMTGVMCRYFRPSSNMLALMLLSLAINLSNN